MKNWQMKRTMEGTEFQRVCSRLKLSQAGAGRWLGFSERTARRIVLDEASLEPAQVLLLRAALKYKFVPEVPLWISPRKAVQE